jgi:hypothetical protein
LVWTVLTANIPKATQVIQRCSQAKKQGQTKDFTVSAYQLRVMAPRDNCGRWHALRGSITVLGMEKEQGFTSVPAQPHKDPHCRSRGQHPGKGREKRDLLEEC